MKNNMTQLDRIETHLVRIESKIKRDSDKNLLLTAQVFAIALAASAAMNIDFEQPWDLPLWLVIIAVILYLLTLFAPQFLKRY